MRSAWLLLATLLALGCDGGDAPTPKSPQIPENDCPDCVETPPVVAHSPLTAIVGGTLAVSADGTLAVAADPESHQIFVVDLASRQVRGAIDVKGAQPGRIVLSDRAAYVALRLGGVAVIDLSTAEEAARFDTCAAPRGLALDGERLHVACAGGDLLTFDASAGRLERRVHLQPDLRDVVVSGDRLLVSTFRSAEVLVVKDGAIADRWAPRSERAEDGVRVTTAPTVAWRMVATGDGGVALLHQRAQTSRVVIEHEGGYGSGDGRCSRAIVAPALTIFDGDGAITRDGVFSSMTLGVDLALHAGGASVAAPGTRARAPHGFNFEDDRRPGCFFGQPPVDEQDSRNLQFTAIAADAAGKVWALSRVPLALVDVERGTQIVLGEGAEDTGHQLFHQNAGRGIACASCHPEGGDDGHVWLFSGFGLRRTQNLRGGIIGSEPFHWEGDLPDMEALVAEVMVKRMGHEPLSAEHTARLLQWIDAQPAIHTDTLLDAAAVERGAALFADATVGCVTCHAADGGRDLKTYDVGTGGYFQVPSLAGIAHRAPYMHDGCAATLEDRFGPCGGGDAHGRTSHLQAAEIADLVAYLKTL